LPLHLIFFARHWLQATERLVLPGICTTLIRLSTLGYILCDEGASQASQGLKIFEELL
jgi:hypothetical protein